MFCRLTKTFINYCLPRSYQWGAVVRHSEFLHRHSNSTHRSTEPSKSFLEDVYMHPCNKQLIKQRKAANKLNDLIRNIATIIANSVMITVIDFYTSSNEDSSEEEKTYARAMAETALMLVIVLSIVCFSGYTISFRKGPCQRNGQERGISLPDYSFIPNIFVTIIVCVLKALIPGFCVIDIRKLQKSLVPVGEIFKKIILKYGIISTVAESMSIVFLKVFHFIWHKLYADRKGERYLLVRPGYDDEFRYDTTYGPCAPLLLERPNLINVLKKASEFLLKDLTIAAIPGFLIYPMVVAVTSINWESILSKYFTAVGADYVKTIPVFVFTFAAFLLVIVFSYLAFFTFKALVSKLIKVYDNKDYICNAEFY